MASEVVVGVAYGLLADSSRRSSCINTGNGLPPTSHECVAVGTFRAGLHRLGPMPQRDPIRDIAGFLAPVNRNWFMHVGRRAKASEVVCVSAQPSDIMPNERLTGARGGQVTLINDAYIFMRIVYLKIGS